MDGGNCTASVCPLWSAPCTSGNRSVVTDEQFEPGRMLALDYGAARIGVAVSDELGLMAHPRPYISARPRSMALRLIEKCVRLEGIGRVMVGLPRNMNGSEGLSARHARQFAKELSEHLGLPVELVDERWSTVEARARLGEAGRNERESKTRIDSASAAVLLQSVLDAEKSRR